MLLLDVNVLVYAHRKDMPLHAAYKAWVDDLIDSGDEFGLSELVLSSFVRITTSPKIFEYPTPMPQALAFAERLRDQRHCTLISAGRRHWKIFADLCRKTGIRGPDVTDAYIAALAIEHDCELITADRDFTRYPGVRWRNALDSE